METNLDSADSTNSVGFTNANRSDASVKWGVLARLVAVRLTALSYFCVTKVTSLSYPFSAVTAATAGPDSYSAQSYRKVGARY